jgi:hypothetical protein
MAQPDVLHFKKLGRGSEWRLYLSALGRGHDVRTRVMVLNQDEVHGTDISDRVTAGQVDLDVTRDPARTLQLTMLDPEYRIAFADPHHPRSGGLWAGSVIRVWYGVLVPDIGADGTWVDVPVFTGPVQTLSRDSQQVNIQAQGKEYYLLPPNAYSNVFSKAGIDQTDHTRKAALVALLNAVGEPQNLVWEGSNSKLPKSLSGNFEKHFHGGGDSYLKLVQLIIGNEHEFYYDGYGTPHVRKKNHDLVFDLTGTELTAASESFDMSTVRNRARATLQRPATHKGGKPPRPQNMVQTLRADAVMSAQHLARSNNPRFLDEKGAATYKSEVDAKAAMDQILRAGTTATYTLDVLPVPFLNPNDNVKVSRPSPIGSDTNDSTYKFQVKSFSFPIHVGDGMSLGYTRKVLDPKHAKARFLKKKATHKHGN